MQDEKQNESGTKLTDNRIDENWDELDENIEPVIIEDAIIFDTGNRFAKSLLLNETRSRASFIHAIQPITKAEFENDKERGNPADLFIIDNDFYRVGYRASAYANTLRGAQRYADSKYHRALIGISTHLLFGESQSDLRVFAGHAPQDISYRSQMAGNYKKKISIENMGTKATYSYGKKRFWDEPHGGMMNKILTDAGTQKKGNNFASGASIIFDIGGYTIDVAVIEKNEVRTDKLDSFTDVNLIGVERAFFYALRNSTRPIYGNPNSKPKNGETTLRDVFVNASQHDIADKLRKCLITGEYDAGGYGMIDLTEFVEDALYPIVNFITQAYTNAGGTQSFNNVFLTGGGAALVEVMIRKALIAQGRVNGRGIYLAGNLRNAIYSNILGAGKLACFYHTQKAF